MGVHQFRTNTTLQGAHLNLARGENYKLWVFAALAIGLFASVADHGSVGVALPTIAEHFNTDLPTSQWVVIGLRAHDKRVFFCPWAGSRTWSAERRSTFSAL